MNDPLKHRGGRAGETMKKNEAGIIVSVRNISDVVDYLVHCSECGKDFIPSLDCDCFAISEKSDSTGEMPLQCENCMMAAGGIGYIDLSRPDGVRIYPAPKPAIEKE
jgi:hypothetical protein